MIKRRKVEKARKGKDCPALEQFEESDSDYFRLVILEEEVSSDEED